MFREIKELGHTGSLNLLYRYITQGRAEGDRPVITPRRPARLLLTHPDRLRDSDTQLPQEPTAACPEPAELARPVRGFAELLTPAEGNQAKLTAWITAWITATRAADLPHLHGFANGLELERAAVNAAALAEYTTSDLQTKPMGRDLSEAVGKVHDILDVLGNVLLEGYPWREAKQARTPTAYRDAVRGTADYIWNPRHPLNQVDDSVPEREPTLKERFVREVGRLARFYARCSTSGDLNNVRDDIAFFRDVRVVVVKLDAARRQAEGRPLPAEVELYLKQLTAGAIEAGDVTDLFKEAGLDQPNLSHLDEAYIKKMQAAKHPAMPSKRCAGWSSKRCARSPSTTSCVSTASPTGCWS